jgi:4-alpha-glucanotransferase
MRTGGILLHISSLPSPYGIGTLGKEAYRFVDFLAESGLKYWQILPIGPTSFYDSPYQSYSTFAGNPYFIDIDLLIRDKLLKRSDAAGYWGKEDTVDYGLLYEKRYRLLKTAYGNFINHLPQDFDGFCSENAWWLDDYALFMTLKDKHGGTSWQEWEPGARLRDFDTLRQTKEMHGQDIGFWKMLQYLFFKQWKMLKTYAGGKGIRIIGDIPIYVALDSVDVWANPGLFLLDENLQPTAVAGCPPDGFTDAGQLWGNPIYNWDAMSEKNYDWWINRFMACAGFYDVTRIDHFRGFDSYYSIPYGSTDAKNGTWFRGPGIEFLRFIEKHIGHNNIIAEDLGFLTDSVRNMLRESGYPGMKVLEFAFDSREDTDYLPHSYTRNCVVYIGTHDNDTALGWLAGINKKDYQYAKKYLGLSKEEGLNWGMMRGAWSSSADLAVVQMQDLLGLSSEARMNTPGTLGNNWVWRMKKGACTKALARKINDYMHIYQRAPK